MFGKILFLLFGCIFLLPLVNYKQKEIAIIGSSGYIGSRLYDHLDNFKITGYDRNVLNVTNKKSINLEAKQVDVTKYKTIIYLGGLTGRDDCNNNKDRVYSENVEDIVLLAKKMTPNQLLIFASTSAIMEGYGKIPKSENDIPNLEKLDLYSNSLYQREIELSKIKNGPKMIGLRFGSVVGWSKSQRTFIAPISMTCSALLNKEISVIHPESHRSFLYMEDLLEVFKKILNNEHLFSKNFEIFHVSSFNTDIGTVASEVSFQTKTKIKIIPHFPNKDLNGFSLNSSKLENLLKINFKGTLQKSVSEIIEKSHQICFGRELVEKIKSVSCPVCRSNNLLTVLDLKFQPLANNFLNYTSDEKYPLKLMRCRDCHHSFLSESVNRKTLFDTYLYQSGTSKTLENHFEFIAKKVVSESESKLGSVLEIASNDGSQLDKFKKLNWKTYGVDPAENLNVIAKLNHNIYTGYWGVDVFDLPLSFDAIIAQNVWAHVPNPVEFLKECKKYMTQNTKLYIQTSQCKMFENGEFDTIYHEHISFFTVHSFKKAAELSDLKITNFEIVPIHGESCLVTFMKNGNQDMIKPFLEKEKHLGMTDDWFYLEYRYRALNVGKWLNSNLEIYKNTHKIIGFGAAAKGIVMLNFLFNEFPNRKYNFSYIIDDSLLKQNLFCPGTNIQVRNFSNLEKENEKVLIVIFAWNFAEEIINKIKSISKLDYNIMIPFPKQIII